MSTEASLTLIAVVVALIIGVASLVQTKRIQKGERKQRLLNEIIEWAQDVIKCSSGLNVPLVRGIERSTMLLYGRSTLYFKYRAVNARSLYVERIAAISRGDLVSTVILVTSKLREFINILEANISTLQKNGTENEEAARECELTLYDLTRALIEKTAEIKVKEEKSLKIQGETGQMAEDEIKELKNLIKQSNKASNARTLIASGLPVFGVGLASFLYGFLFIKPYDFIKASEFYMVVIGAVIIGMGFYFLQKSKH